MVDYAAQGKRNRRAGLEFEYKVRVELEENGWIVTKWNNNIDLIANKFVQAKSNRFGMRQGGFPDFLAFMPKEANKGHPRFLLRFIECKKGKYLSKDEKEKMHWLISREFDCFVAYNNKGKIEYSKFVEC